MIPLAIPNLTGKEAEYTAEVVKSGWVGPDGPFVGRFEDLVAEAAGREWAVAVTSGTAALRVAATVLGFKDQAVGVPADAYPAALHVFALMGCEVSIIDDGAYHDGQMYSHQPLLSLCDRAPAIGNPSTNATLETYSFNTTKTVTTGGGGVVVGDDRGLHEAVREIIRQGHGRPGAFNYRMPNLNAAVGCAQMERLEEFREIKRRIWDRYAEAGLAMIDRGPSRWMATCSKDNLRVCHLVDTKKVEAKIELRPEPFGGISLPCSTSLTEADQDIVIKACTVF